MDRDDERANRGGKSQWARPAIGLALLTLGTTLLWGGAPAWWVGGALLASGTTLLAPSLAPLARELARRPWLAELLSIALVVTVATVMLGDALTTRPVSGDHTVHFAKFLETQALLADTGRPLGWSHDLYAGHPLGYLYPFLPDLWNLAVQALTGADAPQAYGIGLWLFWVTLGLSVYHFGRRAFDRPVGLVAAIAYLTTAGLPHAGGWEYILRWGVWPQWLALAFLLLGCANLERVMASGRPRLVASTGLAFGLALLGHQVSILGLLLALAALTLAWLWGPRPQVRGRRAAWRLGLGLALALLIAAAFLVPFLSTRELTDERGNFWLTSYELGANLLERGSIIGELPVIALAALAGAALALTRRPAFLPVFAAFFALIAFAASHSSVLGELDLLEQSDPFRHVIWYRVVELGKPFYFVLAASALVALVRHLRAREPALGHVTRAAFAFLLGLALAPLAGGVAVAWWLGGPGRDTTILFDQPYAADRAALIDYARRTFPPIGPDGAGFFRVANLVGAADRYLSDLGPELGRPLYKPGFTPVSNYIYKIRSQAPAALAAIDVAYAIADRPLPPAEWSLVETFGELRLYRFLRANPRLARAVSPATAQRELDGLPVRVTAWARERIEVEVGPLPTNIPDGAMLRLGVSSFPRWSATRDGAEVPITTLPLPDLEGTGFIAVPLAPGRWVFQFALSTSDRLALWGTLFGLALALALALADLRWLRARAWGRAAAFVTAQGPRPTWLDGPPPPRWATPASLLLIASATVAALIALANGRPVRELASPRPVDAVLWDASDALDEATTTLGGRPCRHALDRFLCDGPDPAHEVARVPGLFGEFELATCISLEPQRDKPAALVFRDVPPGELSLAFGTRSRHTSLAPRPTTFEVAIDGRVTHIATLRLRPQLDRTILTIPGDRPVELRLEVERGDDDPRHACVSAQVIR